MVNNNLKIGTLTFHIAHNYGAMLQAYALPTAVRKMGYSCEVIDYRFPLIDSWSRVERLGDLIAKYGWIGGGLRYVKRIATGYYRRKDMHINFDYFERNIIPTSKKIYRAKSDLNLLPYDVIIFGSDQIWNSSITGGISEEYIGAFECLPKTKKIAYAASCGTADFQPESKEFYDDCLKSFYAVSVRESEFAKTLIARGIKSTCVVDPTLLLTAEDWKKLLPQKQTEQKRKYLLLYAFEEDEKLYGLAREYAQKNDLEIIAIAYAKKDSMYGMTVLTDCGPLEFLSLFANAEHVITTSFHGTVFSIIFHKDFHCIPHPQYRERTDSLLSLLELSDHNVNELTKFTDIATDWNQVEAVLENHRNAAILFLKETISANKIG